jgi:hypothetical protein
MLQQKPDQGSFTLRKAKHLNGVSEFRFETIVTENDETYSHKHTVEMTEWPHGDFIHLLRKFKDHFMNVMGWAKDKPHGEKLKERLTITGFILAGSGDNETIKITAKFKTAMETEISVNTPNIHLTQMEDSGIVEDVETMEEEAYKFIYEGKEAQQKLDFSEAIAN